MEIIFSELNLDHTIFGSDHTSNYRVLKGVLSDGKGALLNQVR